ncbi:hypothetical protein AB1Y20_015610 [Prymnesium parvum]|uniref:Uncharacterized protein n=1 Tax=Prymnesium parvum TaxID=97485 RepID=A0AB34JX96_PRYPA
MCVVLESIRRISVNSDQGRGRQGKASSRHLLETEDTREIDKGRNNKLESVRGICIRVDVGAMTVQLLVRRQAILKSVGDGLSVQEHSIVVVVIRLRIRRDDSSGAIDFNVPLWRRVERVEEAMEAAKVAVGDGSKARELDVAGSEVGLAGSEVNYVVLATMEAEIEDGMWWRQRSCSRLKREVKENLGGGDCGAKEVAMAKGRMAGRLEVKKERQTGCRGKPET